MIRMYLNPKYVWMSPNKHIFHVILVILILLSGNMLGDEAPSDLYPVASVYEPGFHRGGRYFKTYKDIFNPLNGHFTIIDTLVSLPGRNWLNVDIVLTYNSAIWSRPNSTKKWKMTEDPLYHIFRPEAFDWDDDEEGEITHLTWLGYGWNIVLSEVCLTWKKAGPGAYFYLDERTSWISFSEGTQHKIYWKEFGSNEYYIGDLPGWILLDQDELGLEVLSPDGTRYLFERWNVQEWNFFGISGPALNMKNMFTLTKIVDTNGNYILVEYEGGGNGQLEAHAQEMRCIKRIEDTFGREINFHSHVKSFTGCDFSLRILDSLTYYDSNGNKNKTTFNYSFPTLPHAHNMYFDHQGTLLSYIVYYSNGNQLMSPTVMNYDLDYGDLTSILYPTKGKIIYEFEKVSYWFSHAGFYKRLIKKELYTSLSDLSPDIWTYNYGKGENFGTIDWDSPDGSIEESSIYIATRYDPNLYEGGCYYLPAYRVTKVTDPVGNITVHYFHDSEDIDEFEEEKHTLLGLPQKIEAREGEDFLLRSEEKLYNFEIFRNCIGWYSFLKYYIRRLIEKKTTIGSKSYSTEFDQFDEYENYWLTKEWGDLGISSDDRTINYTYLHGDPNHPNYLEYKDRHIVNCITHKELVGDGTSETWYRYDNTTVHDILGEIINHDNDYGPNFVYRGNVTEVEKYNDIGSNPITKYEYDECGNVVKKINPNNNYTEYEYSSSFNHGYLTREENTVNGIDLITNYDYYFNTGQLKNIEDLNGNITSYDYDALNRLTSIAKPGDELTDPTLAYSYNDNIRRITETKKEHSGNYFNNVYYFYDGLGRLIQIHQRNRDNTSTIEKNIEYDEMGRKQKEGKQYEVYCNEEQYNTNIDWSNGYTQWEYDALGRDTIIIHPDENLFRKRYVDKTITEFNENGDSTKYYYDAYDNLIEVHEHNEGTPHTTYYKYNVVNDIDTIIDANNIVYYNYNSLGWLIEKNHPDVGLEEYVYDNNGNLRFKRDENQQTEGNWIEYTFDEINRPISIGIREYQGDNPLSYANGYPYTLKVQNTYDTYSSTGINPPSELNNPKGNLTKVLDLSGKTVYLYDDRDRVCENQSSTSIDTIILEHDITRSLDLLFECPFTFHRLEHGYFQSKTRSYYSPRNDSCYFETIRVFAGAGENLGQPEGFDSTKIQYCCPELEITCNSVSQSFVTDTVWDVYSLDIRELNAGPGSKLKITLKSSCNCPEEDGCYELHIDHVYLDGYFLTYDVDTTHAYPFGKSFIVSYTYDKQDDFTSITYPDGNVVYYEYDDIGRLENVNEGNESCGHFEYYPNGTIKKIETGSYSYNDWNYSYYPRDWIKTITWSEESGGGSQAGGEGCEIVGRFYEYDNSGNRIFEYFYPGYLPPNPIVLAEYDYDDILRLELEQYPSGDWNRATYLYDALGNRLNVNIDGVDISYEYDPSTNRLINTSNGISYYYDGNGNLTSAWYPAHHFTYDYDYNNQVIKITETWPDKTVYTNHYVYNYRGERLKKKRGSNVTYYVYDESGNVIWEDDLSPNVVENPGFENGTDPWYAWAPNSQTPSTNWELSDVSFTGEYSIEAGPFTAANYENFAQNVGNLEDIHITVPFTLSCYVKTQSLTGGARIEVECWEKDYLDPVGNIYSDIVEGTQDWALLVLTVTELPQGTEAIKVTLQRFIGTGTVWFDAVRCENGSERTPEAKYIYANGKHLAKIVDEDIYYYHNDPLGSSILIRDADGNTVKEYNYYAFGGIRTESGSFSNTHKFTGKELDKSGLYYFGARYMDNAIGRFITPDPVPKIPTKRYLKKPQRLNPYVYCINNPLSRIDPDGLTDILINIQRTPETYRSAIGTFTVQGTNISGATLELPWRNNKPFVSSIPAGTYTAFLFFSKGLQRFVLRLQGVKGRSEVLIHSGTYIRNTKGCPLIAAKSGQEKGQNRLYDNPKSATTEQRLTEYIFGVQAKDAIRGGPIEPTTIQVQIDDPVYGPQPAQEEQY